MADLLRKGKSLFSSTTNSFSTGTGETITPASVAGLPTDTEIVLTFDRTVAGKIERIIGTISGSNFVIRTSPSSGRGADGTTEQSHTAPVVEYIPNAKDMNDLVDAILVGHSQAGAHTAATTSTSGVVELATTAETTTGTDATRVVTPDGLHDMTSLSGAVWMLDEDDMATDSATKVPSQQSVKAYVDSTVTSTAADTTPNPTGGKKRNEYYLTALAGAAEFAAPSGTPVNGNILLVRVKDDGTARALTYNAIYRAMGTSLPSTTVLSKTLYMLFVYNSADSKWDLLSTAQEA